MDAKEFMRKNEEDRRGPRTELAAGSSEPVGSVKIIQILIAPNDSCWQGMLLGLGSDGVTYHCKSGYWEKYIPPVGYVPNH